MKHSRIARHGRSGLSYAFIIEAGPLREKPVGAASPSTVTRVSRP